jgi:ABC-type Fe3+-hydroxamate transport system substrate-binding protein
MSTRRGFLAMVGAAGLLVACGADGGDRAASSEDEGPDAAGTGDGGPATAADTPTVLALGEEYLLADLLTLGIRPIASTANVVLDEGFAGLGEFDTEGIEALPSNEPNLERLAGYRADVVVVNTFVADYLGREVLEGLGGELVVVPDDHAERIVALGDTFDRRSEADAALADLDEAIAAGAATLNAGGRAVSVATVYPGSTVAAWVDGPIDVPATLLAMGFTLRPGATDVEGEEGGRLYLSNEQLDVLDADALVALQSDLVAGEPEALEAMADDPLWSGLPAVASGKVVTIDRLGYPGIAGRRRLVDDLVARLG